MDKCKRYRLRHPDKIKEIRQNYTESGRSAAGQRRHRLKRFGLSEDDYYNRLEQQGYVCLVCGGLPLKRRLSVDHCHQRGTVRGLLCTRCNTAVAMVLENPEISKAITKYIYEHCLA